jgi:hypothetical protein
MNSDQLVAIISSITTCSFGIATVLLQSEKRKIKKLEEKIQTRERQLLTFLNAIQGYQILETEIAEEKGLNIKKFKSDFRNKHRQYFENPEKLEPARIIELILNLKK